MQQLAQHKKLFKPLYKDKLHTVMSKYGARFLKPAAGPTANKHSLENKATTNTQLRGDFEAALAVISAPMGAVDFAKALDDAYQSRNGESRAHSTRAIMRERCCIRAKSPACQLLLHADAQHVNTNEQLEAELKGLHEAGVAELFEDDEPAAALLVKHYDVFLQLLPR